VEVFSALTINVLLELLCLPLVTLVLDPSVQLILSAAKTLGMMLALLK